MSRFAARRFHLAPAMLACLLAAACASSVAGTPQIAAPAPGAPTSGTERSSGSTPAQITTPSRPPVASPSAPVNPAPSGPAPSDQSSAAAASTPSAPAPAPDGATGPAGFGDPYYPKAGNGGYKVDKYDVTLTYDPPSGKLDAEATISAKVSDEAKLGRFNLDLQNSLTVSAITVNGLPAQFTHDKAELTITPKAGLAPGTVVEIVVSYSGEPEAIPGGTSGLGDGGWYRTSSGGAVVVGEPHSASAWFPVNEHPGDPAAFAVTATVPEPWQVISNGLQVDEGLPTPPAGMRTVRWEQDIPIASYLTTLYIDQFTTDTAKLADGTPIVNAYAPGNTEDQLLAAETKQIIEVLEKYFGDYPFAAAGGIYTNEPLPFALETATRPVYADWVDLETVVHEIAHQWYGDDVTVAQWRDICLNECFASYAPWLWNDDTNDADLNEFWKKQVEGFSADPGFWAAPLVDMGAGMEFTTVYTRGPLALHALRLEMGEQPFLKLLKDWPALYGGKNASFDDFEKFASSLAPGKDLKPFMDAWFRGTTVPDEKFLHPGGI